MSYILKLLLQTIKRLLESGVLVLVASIMLLAWVVLWLGVVLIYSLSTTLTQNKTLKRIADWRSTRRGRGFKPAPSND